MSTTNTGIGAVIASLRKAQNKTQEELARYVTVSTQAVSKWENGGVPDTVLLPKIAEFFDVSVDTLFGREGIPVEKLYDVILKTLSEKKDAKEKFDEAYRICWMIERAIFGEKVDRPLPNVGKSRNYSSILSDDGITSMGLSETQRYFMLIPEPDDPQEAYFKDADYPTLFAALGDKDIFGALVFLNSRPPEKAFTPSLLTKKFGLTEEKTTAVIDFLREHQMLVKTEVELDDEIQVIYKFSPKPALIGLLIFARELLFPPYSFNLYMGRREKPYFEK